MAVDGILTPPLDETAVKGEAVERVSVNHAAIVKFAALSVGKEGMPPVMVALSNTNATSSYTVLVSVNAMLRTVCVYLDVYGIGSLPTLLSLL